MPLKYGHGIPVRFLELAANGVNYAALKAADAMAANNVYTMPNAYPASSGYVLACTTGGAMSWVALPTGTVSSVGLSMPAIFNVSGSPVTGSGTLTASLANESANLVFAGPSSGGAAAPTFRALVAADLPTLTGYVVLLPTTPHQNKIKTNSGTVAALELSSELQGGTANLLECYDYFGNLQTKIAYTGQIVSGGANSSFNAGIDFSTDVAGAVDGIMISGTQYNGTNSADIFRFYNHGNTKHTVLNASHKLGINLAGVTVSRNLEVNGDAGIGTSLSVGSVSASNTVLDITGDHAILEHAFTAANGNNNNCAFNAFSHIYITGPNAAFTITGIASPQNGKFCIIHNASGQAMTIANQNAGSNAANRIDTLTGGNLVTAGDGAILMIYSATKSLWTAVSWQA
jgi:hypothetical protein